MPSHHQLLAVGAAQIRHAHTAERTDTGELARCRIEPAGREAVTATYTLSEAPTRRPTVSSDGDLVTVETATIHLLRTELVAPLLPLPEETIVRLGVTKDNDAGEPWVVDPERELVDGAAVVVVPLRRTLLESESNVDPLGA